METEFVAYGFTIRLVTDENDWTGKPRTYWSCYRDSDNFSAHAHRHRDKALRAAVSTARRWDAPKPWQVSA
jgi:hypothetical protein